MQLRLAVAVRGLGYGLVILAVALGALRLAGFAGFPSGHGAVIVLGVLLVAWMAQPLWRSPTAKSLSGLAAPKADDSAARLGPAVSFDVAEREWVHAKLLYRGVHTAIGVARRIAGTVPVVAIAYGAFAVVTRGDETYRVIREPLAAGAFILVAACAAVLLDNFCRAPIEAARTFRERGHLWWPAELSWNAESVLIRNNEGSFRYPLAQCQGWKEDASLILLYPRDGRYWCIPKRALDAAGRLGEFLQLLLERVAELTPYQVVYRRSRRAA